MNLINTAKNIGAFNLDDDPPVANGAKKTESTTSQDHGPIGQNPSPSLGGGILNRGASNRSGMGAFKNFISGFSSPAQNSSTLKGVSGVNGGGLQTRMEGSIKAISLGKVLYALMVIGVLGTWYIALQKHVYSMIQENEIDRANLAILQHNKEKQDKEIEYLANLQVNPGEQEDREKRLANYLLVEQELTQNELMNKLLSIFEDAGVSVGKVTASPATLPEKREGVVESDSDKSPVALRRKIFRDGSAITFVFTVSGNEDKIKQVLELIEASSHFSIETIAISQDANNPEMLSLPVTANGYFLKKSK